jgi:hypothetical protein
MPSISNIYKIMRWPKNYTILKECDFVDLYMSQNPFTDIKPKTKICMDPYNSHRSKCENKRYEHFEFCRTIFDAVKILMPNVVERVSGGMIIPVYHLSWSSRMNFVISAEYWWVTDRSSPTIISSPTHPLVGLGTPGFVINRQIIVIDVLVLARMQQGNGWSNHHECKWVADSDKHAGAVLARKLVKARCVCVLHVVILVAYKIGGPLFCCLLGSKI